MNLAAQVTSAGISAPSYSVILAALQAMMQSIYGADIYIAPDSQDGQFLAAWASAINDTNNAAIDAYNGYSPTFAQGIGLSSVVKINGIARQASSQSTAVGDVVGVAGTTINAGVVQDTDGNNWALPDPTVIPGGGSITVTVTAVLPGNTVAPSGTINKIATPTLGWQTFVSTADAVPGAAVETDAALRVRQAGSTAIPAESPLDGIFGALANLAGVGRVAVYENYTGAPDANGLPAHSISCVISGGDVSDIAEVIGQKKTMGAATYGSTTGTYTDPITGIVYSIHFYVLATRTIKAAVTGTALAGYSSLTATAIKQAVADYINSLAIGADVQIARIYPPALLNGLPAGATYDISGITINISGDPPGTIDLPIAFNRAAICDAAVDVTVTIA